MMSEKNAGHDFDFWLGYWQLSWPAEQTGGKAGERSVGTNLIEKILGDKALQENFSFEEGNFTGRSWSVYNPSTKLWQQTWVDSQGSYLLFTGQFDEGEMELRSEAREQKGQSIINRMVFTNITADSLDWNWQNSKDKGESWQDLWTINYERIS